MKQTKPTANRGRKHSDEEFRREAVTLLEAGRSATQLSRELGVSTWSLCQWEKRYVTGAAAAASTRTFINPPVLVVSTINSWRRAFVKSRHTHGTPRLRHELRDRGHCCSRRRIARLMRQQQLRPIQKRRFVPRTIDSSRTRFPAPQRLLDAPAPSAPGQVWVTDITYIPTQEGWL